MNTPILIQEKAIRNKENRWLNKYKCFCGNEFYSLKRYVSSGRRKNCGCNRIIANKGLKYGLTKHPLYTVWRNIVKRCEDKRHQSYKNYGGRGVRICNEWKTDWKKFYEWCIANGWKKGLQIDKDSKGDGFLYSPLTCSIVTPKQNYNVRRTNHFITHNGETKTIAQWADMYGIHPKNQGNLRGRIMRGWDINEALTKPFRNSYYTPANKINE